MSKETIEVLSLILRSEIKAFEDDIGLNPRYADFDGNKQLDIRAEWLKKLKRALSELQH